MCRFLAADAQHCQTRASNAKDRQISVPAGRDVASNANGAERPPVARGPRGERPPWREAPVARGPRGERPRGERPPWREAPVAATEGRAVRCRSLRRAALHLMHDLDTLTTECAQTLQPMQSSGNRVHPTQGIGRSACQLVEMLHPMQTAARQGWGGETGVGRRHPPGQRRSQAGALPPRERYSR